MDKKKIIIISIIAAVTLLLIVVPIFIFIYTPSSASYNINQHIATEPLQNGALLSKSPEPGSFAIAPTALGDITITALNTTELGVATDSAFLITSDVHTLTETHLLSYLSVRSGESFTLEAQPDNTFLLHFEENLTNNQIYNLIYQPPGRQAASHAFQTTDIFRITATSPANHTHGIPYNAGIEVTFSQPLAADFSTAFIIDPPAEGRFYERDNTFIFAPYSLDFNTIYTVTITQGLASVTGEVLAEDYTFSFTTQWGTATAPLFSISGNAYETFLPWDEVFIAINVSRDFTGRDFYVSLYDLQTPENFIEAGFYPSITGHLIETFALELYEFESDWQTFSYLFLEQTLPVGYYLAEIRSAQRDIDIVLRKLIQVSALSVYSLSIAGESVFWVHDASTGQPANRAQIRIDGQAVTTSSDGIAVTETTQNSRAIITIEYGSHLPFAYTKPLFSRSNLLPSGRFLSYMYTDRPNYRPNDTVDIFGVIKPRYGHAHLPEDVFTLRFGDMLVLPIELDRFNTFTKRVPVTNMFSGVDIVIEVNGERLMSRWTNFSDYTNLGYILTGDLDRIAYLPGEYADAEILVTTFAGLPAEAVTLTMHRYPGDNINLATDHAGLAAGSIPIQSTTQGWEPYWNSFWFSITSEAQVSQSVSLPKIVVPRDIMMEHEYTGGDTISVTTSQVLIDRINAHYTDASAWASLDPDIYRGAAVDVDFTVMVTRYVTTRTIRRQQYDRINRRTITTYDFDTTSSLYRTIPGRTVNGQTVVTGLPVSEDPLIRYRIEIHYQDASGRETVVWLIDHSWRNFRQESSIRHFGFVVENRSLGINETTLVSLAENPDPWGGWWSDGFDDDAMHITEGRLLTILVRDRVISATAGSPQGMPVTFTEECISNAILFGAYFDGRYIFPITNPATIFYDHAERALEITLDFDEDHYRPGDEVTVTIQTSAPAQVVISVVDESSILSWHDTDFLARLYQSSRLELWGMGFRHFQFASHTQHNFGGAGYGTEGGGGGDEAGAAAFREDFSDNPVFEVVQTDHNGRGTLTFTLPDQVTSWRVTALGLTEDGYAGDTRDHIVSVLPFYIDLILTNEYIAGDDVAALVRVFGAHRAPVNFTLNVLRNDTVIYTDTLTSIGNVVFNAGKLDAGDYIMQVSAAFGDYSDAMALPFTVAESGMILPIRAAGPIEDIGEFNMRALPVRITLTNANIGPLMNILTSVWHSRSYRTDYIAATAYIHYFLNFTDTLDVEGVRSRIHGASGGIPELVYEYEDFYYTARFAASFPEFVNRERLIRYIRGEMAETYPMRYAAGLLALAAAGEPVLLQTQAEILNLNLESQVGYMEFMPRLYLAAALVALGDYTGAMQLVESMELERFLYAQRPVLSNTELESIATAMLFINTAIHPPAAWDYLNRGYENEHVSDAAERINFVRRARFLGETVSEVQYYLNGTTHTARLENFDRLTLHLSKDQFDALNLIPISGATDFHIDFYGYDAANWDTEGNRINIQRRIIRDGDLFRIELSVTLPPNSSGFFTIYDRLPSNMRFVPLRRGSDWDWYWANRFFVRHTQRQLVEISFWADRDTLSRTLIYHAMELFEADMAIGTTYISNGDAENHIWGMTE